VTNYRTPSASGFGMVRPSEEEKVDKVQGQHRFLLYLVKLSTSDLANPVRDPSRDMHDAAPCYLILNEEINFVAQTKDKGLKMRFSGKIPWEIEGFSYSDFAAKEKKRHISKTFPSSDEKTCHHKTEINQPHFHQKLSCFYLSNHSCLMQAQLMWVGELQTRFLFSVPLIGLSLADSHI
jgi:hypothetical protein